MSERVSAGPVRLRAGFSLIELTIALVILSVGVIGMASVMASSNRVQRLSRSRMEMLGLAEGKIEELRAIAAAGTADTVQLGMGGSFESNIAHHHDTVAGGSGRSYVRRWVVTAGAAGTRSVTVRVQPVFPAHRDVAPLDLTTLLLVGEAAAP